jgi:hypothetical protein
MSKQLNYMLFKKRAAVVDRKTTWRGIPQFVVSVTVVMMLALSLAIYFTPVNAGADYAAALCGDGSAPDYGFTYDLQQTHWTVDWQNHVSEQTVNEVDTILDRLNADSIAQTMILIQPQEQVGNRVNCVVHFLRYMKLGNPSGERKDNGFAFLIVVEPTRIDVHYGVGLGLPALTASDLTTLNRAAEDTYQTTHSLDQALLALVQGFDTVARSKYTPLIPATPLPNTNTQPQMPSGPLNILTICGQLCLGIIVLLFMLWGARNGIRFNSSGFGSRGGFGGSFGGGRGGSSTRGGGGSGRSGRGN